MSAEVWKCFWAVLTITVLPGAVCPLILKRELVTMSSSAGEVIASCPAAREGVGMMVSRGTVLLVAGVSGVEVGSRVEFWETAGGVVDTPLF